MWTNQRQTMTLSALRQAYAAGRTPRDVLANVTRRIASEPRKHVWIHVLTPAQLEAQLAALDSKRRAGTPQPLYGIPFAVKDNIDVAGIPTTAACPAYQYTPATSATVVQRLTDAGAIVVGKTNLDQFATGLVGTRSTYGACENAFNPEYVSGGSSSGSAVSVATGQVSFSLGTDTAGSGRVPASFNALVGLKPTRGLLSNTGVVPACRSLDCVSIFATSCADAAEIFQAAAGFDPTDPLSRSAPAQPATLPSFPQIKLGVPTKLDFFGDRNAESLFQQGLNKATKLGATLLPIDYEPFRKTADLLYEGPWVVERLKATEKLLAENPRALRPELLAILKGASRFTAADVFDGYHALESLRRAAHAELDKVDFLLLPTTGTFYRIAEVEADPLRLNRNYGYYTNFVNLLDLSAIAVPNGFLPAGVPMGITLIGRAFQEPQLLALGDAFTQLADPLPGDSR